MHLIANPYTMLLSLLLYIQLAVLSAHAESWIVPGAPWTDTSGNTIQAHGGGFIQVRLQWHYEVSLV